MTLSEVSSLLPPPEGMEWKDQSFRGEAHFYLSHLCPPGGCTVMREPGGWTVYASAGNASAQFALVTDADLPAAYLRALQAVGLAPGAEKEDMRRRLTWTSEVPTKWGDYIVRGHKTRGRGTIWTLGEDGWINPNGNVSMAPTFAALFMPCPQSPKEVK